VADLQQATLTTCIAELSTATTVLKDLKK